MASKHDKTGRSKVKLTNFIALERYMTASPAWKTLSLPGRCAYLEVLDLYNGKNNGTIALSARGLSDRLGISRATAARALYDLTARGFIEPTRIGGFNIKTGVRRATEWRLTRYNCNRTGEVATQKYMRWQEGKIHFTVSPESHHGLTTEPPTSITQQNCRNVALS